MLLPVIKIARVCVYVYIYTHTYIMGQKKALAKD